MGETTTVRVRTSTRDQLNSAAAGRDESVDDVITSGLAALRREEWRRQAEIDARAAAADPADRAEVAAILADLAGEPDPGSGAVGPAGPRTGPKA